jgi:four helix bundle protein
MPDRPGSVSSTMGDFKRLRVWRKSLALTVNVKRGMSTMRGRDLGPLRSQLIRAVMSIGTNIAEGSRKASLREFAKYVGYAIDSSVETEHHLIVAHAIASLPRADCKALCNQVIEVRRMAYGLRTRLQEMDARRNPRADIRDPDGTEKP